MRQSLTLIEPAHGVATATSEPLTLGTGTREATGVAVNASNAVALPAIARADAGDVDHGRSRYHGPQVIGRQPSIQL